MKHAVMIFMCLHSYMDAMDQNRNIVDLLNAPSSPLLPSLNGHINPEVYAVLLSAVRLPGEYKEAYTKELSDFGRAAVRGYLACKEKEFRKTPTFAGYFFPLFKGVSSESLDLYEQEGKKNECCIQKDKKKEVLETEQGILAFGQLTALLKARGYEPHDIYPAIETMIGDWRLANQKK